MKVTQEITNSSCYSSVLWGAKVALSSNNLVDRATPVDSTPGHSLHIGGSLEAQ